MRRFALLAVAAIAFLSSPIAVSAAVDDEIPGVPLRTGATTASFEADDEDDVYSFSAPAGRRIEIEVSATDTSVCLFLFPPGSVSIFDSDTVVPDDGCVTGFGYTVPAGKGGTYYLDVFNQSDAGDYSIELKLSGAGGPTTVVTPKPAASPPAAAAPLRAGAPRANARTTAAQVAATPAASAVPAPARTSVPSVSPVVTAAPAEAPATGTDTVAARPAAATATGSGRGAGFWMAMAVGGLALLLGGGLFLESVLKRAEAPA